MTSTSDSQCESLRRQQRQVGVLLSASLLLFVLVSWRMPILALAIVTYVLVSFAVVAIYLAAWAIGHWWINHR